MKHTLFFCSLLGLLLFGAFAVAEVPQWIQSEERLVGENSTQYEDTLNRPTKTVWNTFLVGHDSAGDHTLTPDDIGAVSQSTFDNFTGHTHALPTLGELGAAADDHTHALPTLGELGAASAADVTALGNTVNALEIVAPSVFELEHNADGTHDFEIPPSGGMFGLESSAHGNPFVSFAFADFPAMSSSDLQLVVMVNPEKIDVAEELIGVKNDAYSCNRLIFGKNSTNQLFVTVGTDLYDDVNLTILCTETTYTSPDALDVDGRWHEYAVQLDSAGNVTFYVDGVADAGQVMTAPLDVAPYGAETFTLGSGFWGGIASAKVGGALTWATTGKALSFEGLLFPGALSLFALNEGTGTTTAEALTGTDLTIDSGLTWVDLPGRF